MIFYKKILSVIILLLFCSVGNSATITKGLIGEEDLKKYDGVSTTFSRTTSTGGTVVLNKVGYTVDVLMVYGNGDSYSDSTINKALNAIGSNKTELVLRTGTWTIGDNVTIPSTVTLTLQPGALLSVSSGKTFTINGQVNAGNYQIFGGSGSISGLTATGDVNALWFGSFTNAAVTSTLTALGTSNKTTILLQSGTWTISANVDWSTYTNVTFKIASGALISHGTYTVNIPNLEAGSYPIFSGTGAVTLSGSISKINPQWFGASPSATAAVNVAAFQAAIDSISTTTLVIGSWTADASTPYISIPAGKYQLNDKLTTSYYTKMIAEGQAIFEATDATKDIIYSQHPYHNEFKGITFTGGKSHINILNGTDLSTATDGLEGVFVKVTDCHSSLSADYALKFARNATNGGFKVMIEKSEYFWNSQMLYAYYVDGISIDDVWLEPDKAYTADDLAQIVNNNSNMTVNKLLTAHSNFDNPTTNRWFDTYGYNLEITNSRFGAESGGGLPLVYNFVDALATTTLPYMDGGRIIIRDSITYCYGGGGTDAGVVVLKSGLPNVIIYEGNTGLSANIPIVNTAVMTGAVSLATYMGGISAHDYYPMFNIQIRGNATYNSLIASSAADIELLKPYLVVNQTYRTAENTAYNYPTGNYNYAGNYGFENVFTTNLYGKTYAQTSVSPAAPNDTISIVDTGIAVSATSAYGVYLVCITGNPNVAGSASNTDTIIGLITLTTASPTVSIAWTDLKAGGTLTVTPTISSNQIRIAIGNYAVGWAGGYQVVRIMKLL